MMRQKLQQAVALFALLFSVITAWAQPGSLDTTFGNSPINPASNTRVSNIVVQPDGKILISGSFGIAGTARTIVRLNANGTLDTGFDPGTGPGTAGGGFGIEDMVLQPDGKILIGGSFTSYNGTPARYITRLNPDGSLDTGFNAGGFGIGVAPTTTTLNVNSILLQPDGKIVVGGSFLTYNGTTRQHVLRLLPDGTLDPDFNPQGTALTSTATNGGVKKMALQPDGKIVLAGSFTAGSLVHIARLNTDGTLDASFNPGGSGFNIGVSSIFSPEYLLVRPDGTIIVSVPGKETYNGEDITSYGYGRNFFRLLPDGTKDSTQPTANYTYVNSMLELPDGGVIITGRAYPATTNIPKGIARLNEDLSPDDDFNQGFNPGGAGTGDAINTNIVSSYIAALQPDGKLLIGGNFTTYNGVSRRYVARLHLPEPITVTSVSGEGVYCGGSMVEVSYSVSAAYNPGNFFIAQLSDANGSFANPVTIGVAISITSGTITATLPNGLPAGTGYRIRVISSSPATTGIPYEENLAIYPVPEAPEASAQQFCESATVGDLAVTLDEDAVAKWYAAADATEALADGTVLTTGSYYVSQSFGECESPRTEVAVTVNDEITAPVAEAQDFCGQAAVADLEAQGDNLKWYASVDATEELADTTILQTGTYYVSQTIGDCESERAAVEVTINEIPDAPVAETQTFCGEVTVSNLEAQGDNLKWYASVDATEELADIMPIQAGAYYVSQTVNGCESERTAVEITVNEIPDAPVTEDQTFCGDATVADLTVIGAALKWYVSADAVESLANDTILQTGIYYVSQTLNSCESERVAVEVTINEIPDAPVAASQSFCGDAAVADLVAAGTDLDWYAAADAAEALPDATVLQTGTYYVSQTVDGCESERAAVVVTVNGESGDAPVAESQSFCGDAAVADLVATGTDLNWYAAADATEALSDATALQTGTYYVSQTVEGGCESPRAAVEITVNEIPFAPIAQDQSFCGPSTIAYLSVTIASGASARWYAGEDTTEALPSFTFIYDGQTYYVSQVLNGCESERTAVTVTVNPIPLSPVASAQSVCAGSTVAVLAANGDNLLWYADETGGEPLSEDTVLTEGLYYVSQTVNGCESPGTAVAVTINNVLDAPVASAQSFCGNATVADLAAQGNDLKWYASADAAEALSADTLLQTATYYVSQTVEGCGESPRTAVTVTVSQIPDAPLAASEQQYQAGATLNDLFVEGENLSWYDEQGNELPGDTLLTDTTYYVSQTVNGCESETIAVTATETLSTSSVDDIAFSYYPNPVTDLLYISYSENITSVVVFNSLGQQLKIVNGQSSEMMLDLADFPAATYIVKMIAGDKEKMIKIVKR